MLFHRLLSSFLPRSNEVRKASFSDAWPRLARAIYGSDLHIPFDRTTRATYPTTHPLLTALRPFRRRLHGQRLAVGALRLGSGALVAATAVLAGRLVFGPAWPLLLLVCMVGAVLAAGLVALAVRPPSWRQVALAVDRGLYLREQLETAIETVETTPVPMPGSVVARLQAHAVQKLQVAPLRATPWPSLRGERRLAAILGVVAALAFWMVHSTPSTSGGGTFAGGAPPMGSASSVPGLGPAHGRLSTTTGRNGGRITVLSPARGHTGQTSAGSPRTGGVGTTGLGLTPLRSAPGSSTAPSHGGKSGVNGAGQGQGQAQGQGRGGAPGSARAGVQPGAGARHVKTAPGANSSAARLSNPAQSPLLSLQNSINQAQRQGQNGNASASAAGTSGAKSQPNPAGARGRKKTSNAGKAGRNQSSSSNAGTRGDALNRSSSGTRGTQGSQLGHQNQQAGNEDLLARRGQATAGSGSGHGAATHVAAANGTARFSQGQTITLGHASGKAGQTLTIEAGSTQRGGGAGTLTLGGTDTGAASAPLVTVPGYVASDDNTVAPALRTTTRGYFTPRETGQ